MKHAATLILTGVVLLACNLAGPPPGPTQSLPVTPSAAPAVPATQKGEMYLAPTATGFSTQVAPIKDLLGAVSAEQLMTDVTALSAIHSRQVNSATIGDAAQYIHDQFAAAGGRLVVEYDEFLLVFNGGSSSQRNVIATLPGSDPSAGIVVIGAHYDSRTADLTDSSGRAPGANDNATGVAAVLELARIMAHERPRATIQFVAFSGEEVGRKGSIHFVEQGQARGEVFRGMIALDIVGNGAGSSTPGGSIRVFSAGPEGSPSRELARSLAAQAETYLPGFDVLVQDAIDRPHRYSDHNSFSEAGFAAVRLIQAQEDPDNHSGGDTADHVDGEYLRRATQTALVGIMWLLELP